jgi:hypothetical protein
MKSQIIIPKVATLEQVALELGDVMAVRNLAVARLYANNSYTDNKTVLLSKAIQTGNETGSFTVTESGEVRSLKIKSDLDTRVFVPAGVVIEGDSQNRMSLYSVMVPAHAGELSIPVRCVEQGQGLRTGSRSGRYSASNTVIMPTLRGGDQHKTWTGITVATRMLDVRDVRKENYSEVLNRTKLTDYTDELGPHEDGQIGYVAAIANKDGGVEYYVDFFGNQDFMKGLYGRLTDSVAFVAKLRNQDSVRSDNGELTSVSVGKDDLATFLQTIAEAEATRVPKTDESVKAGRLGALISHVLPARGTRVSGSAVKTVGEGDLYKLDKAVDGSTLVVDGAYVQVFSKHILN